MIESPSISKIAVHVIIKYCRKTSFMARSFLLKSVLLTCFTLHVLLEVFNKKFFAVFFHYCIQHSDESLKSTLDVLVHTFKMLLFQLFVQPFLLVLHFILYGSYSLRSQLISFLINTCIDLFLPIIHFLICFLFILSNFLFFPSTSFFGSSFGIYLWFPAIFICLVVQLYWLIRSQYFFRLF